MTMDADWGLDLVARTNQHSLAYWDGLRRGREMPARADLEPADMLAFISHVILLDVLEDPLDFRYRLIGTKIVFEQLLTDHTGRHMSELSHQSTDSRIFQNCKRVVETRRPFGGQTPYVGQNAEFKSTEDVILPLSADGGRVDMLFVTADFVDPAIA